MVLTNSRVPLEPLDYNRKHISMEEQSFVSRTTPHLLLYAKSTAEDQLSVAYELS